jgi:hypothetical protein
MTKPFVHELVGLGFTVGEQPEPKPRRARKPRIDRAIAAAERAGKTVRSVTMPDGVTLRFDEPAPTEASNAKNPWDEVLTNGADQKRPS